MADSNQLDFTDWPPRQGAPFPSAEELEHLPEIKLAAVGNVYIRMMNFRKAGDFNQGHTHRYDHITLLSKGSLEVVCNGETTIFTAPAMIYIDKDQEHKLTALEDNTLASCIHALRDADTGEIVSPDMIPKGSNPYRVFPEYNLEPLNNK